MEEEGGPGGQGRREDKEGGRREDKGGGRREEGGGQGLGLG